jgi:hypothetical protein
MIPQSPDRGKRPGDFDPKKLFGAAWWLTPSRDTGAAQATGARPLVPTVTVQEAYQSFCGEFFLLTFEAIEWFGVSHTRFCRHLLGYETEQLRFTARMLLIFGMRGTDHRGPISF